MAEQYLVDKDIQKVKIEYGNAAQTIDDKLEQYSKILNGLIESKAIEGVTADKLKSFIDLVDTMLSKAYSEVAHTHNIKFVHG